MTQRRLLMPIIIATILLTSAQIVSANDSDGDGTDDLYDDFPNDPCADTDTDGDGLPDTVVSGCTSYSVTAYTSFEDPFTNGAKYYDTGNQSQSRYLWNNANEPHIAHNQTTGSEMGFSLFYTSTGGVGLTDGDFFGTANYTGTVGNYTDGGQGYQMGDVDGSATLILDSVAADSLALDIFIQGGSSNSYEASDNLIVRFVGATSTVELVNVTGATGGSNNGGFATYMGVWTSLSGDISSLGQGNLEIEFISNSQTESVYIDNVAFTSSSQLVEDTDDDNDGWDDVDEVTCGTDPLDSNDIPSDSNGNGVCDATEGDDFDGDGIPNDDDPDDDNDGYDDIYDAFPLDPTEWDDADGDGIGSNTDTDDDGDGWSDSDEADCLTDSGSAFSVPDDNDGDGACDIMDIDDDNDGYEDENDCAPYDPNISLLDCDGVCGGPSVIDACGVCGGDDSTCSDCAGVPNGDAVIDECGICVVGGNQTTCVIDSDGDGVDDDSDMFPDDNQEWGDFDGDGIGDNADTDDDGDGCEDSNDDLPTNANECFDTDGDGIGDNADMDDDGDGWSDDDEVNCVGEGDNPQLDADSTPVDSDGDGLCDHPMDLDDDNDGWSDEDEESCETEKADPNEAPTDIDTDGICDQLDLDDDGDGVPDTDDSFPTDVSEWMDTDGDGLGDNSDLDDDGDQFSDEDEAECGSNPSDSDSTPGDSDGDGICDSLDDFNDSESDDTPGLGIISVISVLALAAIARRE